MKIRYFINEDEVARNKCKDAIYHWAQTDGYMLDIKAKPFTAQVMKTLKREATEDGISIFARNGTKYIAMKSN